MPKGKKTSFKSVVEEYYEALYRYAYTLARNPADASDLTQQTFVIYANKRGTIKDASKTKSWLYTSLYREFIRNYRRKSVVTAVEPEILESSAPPVEPKILEKIDSQQAVEILHQLPEKYRDALALFYINQLTYKEIAQTLGVPTGTVMSRLSRGKSLLKQAFFQHEK